MQYHSYGSDFREAITFKDFCQLKGINRGKGKGGGSYTHGTILKHTMGRLFHPTFNGSSKSSSKARVKKLDVYFQLNQMMEGAIKIATMHLEGEARDWWFHGLTMMGHARVTTYKDFTRRALECFERRDLEEHFGELTRLK